MGWFGSDKDEKCRSELERVKIRLFGYGNEDCLNVTGPGVLGGHNNRIDSLESREGSVSANTRVCQIVAVLLNILPKKDLDKKLDQDDMKFGSVFPASWFDDNDKSTVKNLLEEIDP